MRIFGVIPFIKYKTTLKQQLNGEKQWKMRWRAKPLSCFSMSCVEHYQSFFFSFFFFSFLFLTFFNASLLQTYIHGAPEDMRHWYSQHIAHILVCTVYFRTWLNDRFLDSEFWNFWTISRRERRIIRLYTLLEAGIKMAISSTIRFLTHSLKSLKIECIRSSTFCAEMEFLVAY